MKLLKRFKSEWKTFRIIYRCRGGGGEFINRIIQKAKEKENMELKLNNAETAINQYYQCLGGQ